MGQDILNQLNEAQRKAVEHTEGPSMVIAGAGSGKTRVLTYRVAHLLNTGVDPFNVLALTFTNKAAREMKERILKLVGNADARNVWMGTFHSIFARILRVEGHFLGYPSNFSIYDTEDSKRLIRNIIKEMDLDPKVYNQNYILNRISGAKTSLITPQVYNSNFEITNTDSMAGKPRTGEIYSRYANRLKKADAMDFDDLLFNTYILFRDFPDVLYKYQKRFRYILVDEYQDTNHVQYMIVKSLAADNENICVVGDDAQSIYAFRGANIQNILNFKKDYPDLSIFKLEQNYRSTKNIVNAANSVIKNNKEQIHKTIWTQNDEGKQVSLLRAASDSEEGIMIADAIFREKMNKQLPNSHFAILYRTNAQSRSFEESLRRLNVPYRIYGGLSFYKRKEIKDLLAYFRLVINNNDEDALLRVINYPTRGIGQTTIERAIIRADALGISLWQVIGNPTQSGMQVNVGVVNRLQTFVTMIKSFSVQLKTKNAFDLGKQIASSSGILKDLYEDKTPEGLSRYENIEELLNAIKDFTEQEIQANEDGEIVSPVRTLDEFMQDIALLTDADEKDKDDNNHVSLMTVHAAKGLEFPYVYVVGMEENLFPSIMSLNNRADLEEERRLFYVALTRAMQHVTVSYAESRYRWGNLTPCEPSRFIEEIDEKFVDYPRQLLSKPRKTFPFEKKASSITSPEFTSYKKKSLKKIDSMEHKPAAMNPDDIENLQAGMQVMHERFGKGKVIAVEGLGGNKKATVFFNKVGQKQLLLK
ncbi:MAG TPA: UvrD-helicase domain-containing protein, partial [Bacteroidales bacterium]|nr:UvrD-helicase domain-containing protein [Bacteroidales bacterium]